MNDRMRPGRCRDLFPLPTFSLSSSDCLSSSSSRRVRLRCLLRQRSARLANLCVKSLNDLSISLSSSPSARNPPPSSISPSSLACNNNNNDLCSNVSQEDSLRFIFSSAVQFLKSRPSVCDPGTVPFLSPDPDASPYPYFSVPEVGRLKIIASRVDLPSQPGVVDLLSVLPPDLARRYSDPSQLLRKNVPSKTPRARVHAEHGEYVALVNRMAAVKMITFVESPACVNGVFGVKKDADAIRLIIDARPANALFVDPDPVQLPSPAVLAQLSVPKDSVMYTAKSDLSNFYHRLKLPAWMQPYFALPPVRCSEVGLPGGDKLVYPCCTTLPMGFSHSVYLAQAIHEHIVDSRSSLREEDRMISARRVYELAGSRVFHMIYIDDVLFFSLDKSECEQALSSYENAVTSVGLPTKVSKRVSPTCEKVEGLGLTIDGRTKRLGVSASKLWSLCDDTVALFQRRFVTGDELRVIIGRWTWACLVNRPSLSAFNVVYRYTEVAGPRPFTLWPSAKRELQLVLGLAPILFVDLSARYSERVVATDASGKAQGVVASCVSPVVVSSVVAENECGTKGGSVCSDSAVVETCSTGLRRFVERQNWKVIVSARWRAPEHINSLELRAVSTAVRWLVSSSSRSPCFGHKVLVLSDSMVAVGALRKGRSPSRLLLRRVRAIAAVALAFSLRLTVLWIPTDINPADEPSRI